MELSGKDKLFWEELIVAVRNDIWRDATVAMVIVKRELERSADYVEQNMPDATIITSGDRGVLFNFLPNILTLEGHIAEFGVYRGDSINQLASTFNSKTIWGFDSFLGLEENFSIDYLKGGFNLHGIPPLVRENVSLVVGSFSDTLPTWLKENPGVFSFINIDCDTYESTTNVLNFLGPKKIVSGTVIIFDEYIGFPGWEKHEFRAWQEYCNKNNVKYKYLAINGLQVLIQVL